MGKWEDRKMGRWEDGKKKTDIKTDALRRKA
jgi:hypothetical protein